MGAESRRIRVAKGGKSTASKPRSKPVSKAKKPAQRPKAKVAPAKAKPAAHAVPKKAPSKPSKAKSSPSAPAEPAAPALPPRGDGRRHVLSLSFLRDGDEFMARLETDAGEITELKNRSLDQLLTLVANELEDLLE